MNRNTTTHTVTTTTVTRYIDAAELRAALQLPARATIFFDVPGGGDWSNESISIDEQALRVEIITVEESTT